ncbi:MAG: phosphatidylserine decarboxylase, partial [Pseudomonadota bacterium]
MDDSGDLSSKRFPWARSGFDLEGYVGALAAWLVGILLGILWSPLFWIGFVAAIIILFATRTAERTTPDVDDAIIAPCDGIVVSVAGAAAPDELRLEGTGWTRVRISAGPTATNGLYAPLAGEVDHIIRETGDPAAFYAGKPDKPGLAVAYVSFVSGDRASGYRVATGGLGPRLEIASEAGDAVRMGRNVGTMRLGGWCDLYVPSGAGVGVAPGQTLTGGETVIARFGKTNFVRDDLPVQESATPAPDYIDEILEDTVETDASTAADEGDVSEMFERLRAEARKSQDGG